jgi:homocysteine S-methyltransferase
MGHNIDGNLWSAMLLRSNPRAIVDATRAFLDAGARIVTTASYQASREGLTATGLTDAEADALILSSVTLARRACDEVLVTHPDAPVPLVAASIGPYGAILHDGSEYRGDYALGRDALRAFHAQRLAVLDSSDADLLACETIPSAAEAAVLAELLRDARLSAWISFSCRDGSHLADGTPLTAAAAGFADHPQVLAVGVNCVPPERVVPLIRTLRAAVPGKSIVVYPNSGETYSAADNRWLGTANPLQCRHAVDAWLAAGATLVGGCCRIGPTHIAAMSEALNGPG